MVLAPEGAEAPVWDKHARILLEALHLCETKCGEQEGQENHLLTPRRGERSGWVKVS
jgi:hypothetical protein